MRTRSYLLSALYFFTFIWFKSYERPYDDSHRMVTMLDDFKYRLSGKRKTGAGPDLKRDIRFKVGFLHEKELPATKLETLYHLFSFTPLQKFQRLFLSKRNQWGFFMAK